MARDDSQYAKYGKNAPDPSKVYPFESTFSIPDEPESREDKIAEAPTASPVVPGDALDRTLGGSGPAGEAGFGPGNPNAKRAEAMGPTDSTLTNPAKVVPSKSEVPGAGTPK